MVTQPQAAGGAVVRPERLAKVQRAVDAWVGQLIDLTARNQLLYYRTLKRGTLELTDADPDPLQGVLAARKVRLSTLFRPTESDLQRAEDAARRARTIHDKALEHFEERGIDTLFLAWGMATWTTKTSSGTPCAPVLLRPLRIAPRGAASTDFELELHGDWTVNEALLYLLATEFSVRVEVDDLLVALEDVEGSRAPDPTGLFARLAKEAAEVPGFAVAPRTVAGTFLYTKLPMVRDLQGAVPELAAHDLIAGVAGDEQARRTMLERRATGVDARLPDVTPADDEYLILDADASQTVAINKAVRGESLVVQGPPGTGKSQTIANLIATLIARGQRVLFVAEKRAAIEAVTKRLDQHDLRHLVLDLHGGVTSKRRFAEALGEALERIGATPAPDVDDVHHRLETTRGALVAYEQALHEVCQPWGVSLWDVQARLLAHGDRQPLMTLRGSRLTALDSDVARTARDHLVEWADLAEPFLDRRSPWTGAAVDTDAQASQALELAEGLAEEVAPRLREELDAILGATGFDRPAGVTAWTEILQLLSEVAESLERYSPEVWDLDIEALVQDLAPGEKGGPGRAWAHLTGGRYRQAKQRMRAVRTAEGKGSGPDLLADASAACDRLARWRALGAGGPPAIPGNAETAAEGLRRLQEQLAGLGAYLSVERFTARAHDELLEPAEALAGDQANLFRLPRVRELERWCAEHHLEPLLEAVRHGGLRRDAIEEAFDHAWLSSIRAHLVASDRRLAQFDGKVHTRRVREFGHADRQHIALSAARIRRLVAVHAVQALDEHPAQAQVVQTQARKQRRHLTLRRLFGQAPDVLTALRPCWVMSPLVVAQTLPPRQIFDVVIFDEASQVQPADAIPALLRAPQAVVAGDRHQLPPTAFFDGTKDGDGEDDDEDDGTALTAGFESVLDVLDAFLTDTMLSWHYRSRDERLIAFSNHAIYRGGLTTFPGASGDLSLAYERVPHVLGKRVDTRSNEDEVQRVVELMLTHARERADESLGVIAMGQHHASRIEAALRGRLVEEGDEGLEAFFDESRDERAFVKNLERVQGDERDAIVLTLGYAKQPDGRLYYRFGPLTRAGIGTRRLNVAVTRARKRLTLVASFSHADMDPSRSSSDSIDLLRRYLKYVESGGAELEGAEAAVPLNPFELSVLDRLQRAGVPVVPQYGVSGFRLDFACPHPRESGRMVLAVEADGASYHSTPTARDRDRLRQQVLEALGWRFHRIWSTDWFQDPEAEVEKVKRAYEEAVAAADRARRDGAKAQGSKRAGAVMAPAVPPPPEPQPRRVGPRPPIPTGPPITQYRHDQLVELARWIASDGLLRTEEQMEAAIMQELEFRKRGKRIVEALRAAIRDSKR